MRMEERLTRAENKIGIGEAPHLNEPHRNLSSDRMVEVLPSQR